MASFKYDSLGQLTCSICNVVVKSSNLWGTHIAGKIHKENLTKQKKSTPSNDFNNTVAIGIKRNTDQPEVTKKIKSDMKPPEKSEPPKAASLLANYSDSDDSDMDTTDDAVPSQNSSNNGLPPDFFDSSASNINSTTPPVSASETPMEENVTAVAKSTDAPLPEGFFDDPVLDAKARNIEYKDPVEEEWEKFQKAIAEETNVSNTIIEVDLEETVLERDIEQIDEQIHQWERVKNLQVLADDVKMKTVHKDDDNNESGNTDDDLDEDDLLDWRSKGVKKS
ncbi:Zinc finger protein 830 like protein [Argiope bruennichi]|uniref:Zinc finger protein 830 n=1 Tax=Argiope bruennichi TaxID=94029 RepID=A0A8T0E7V6_ARGBR|nr:Zinc finger protein 830 like protein [Argiope bruennichi]